MHRLRTAQLDAAAGLEMPGAELPGPALGLVGDGQRPVGQGVGSQRRPPLEDRVEGAIDPLGQADGQPGGAGKLPRLAARRVRPAAGPAGKAEEHPAARRRRGRRRRQPGEPGHVGLRGDPRVRRLEGAGREVQLDQPAADPFAQAALERPRPDHPVGALAVVGDLDDGRLATPQHLQQRLGVQGGEAGRVVGALGLDLQGRIAQGAREELVHRLLDAAPRHAGEDRRAGDELLLHPHRGSAAGIRDEHHVGHAAIAGEHRAARHIHRLRRPLDAAGEQPVFAVVDVEPMAGKVDQQLFDPRHRVEQLADAPADVLHRHLPGLVGDEPDPLRRKPLGQRPLPHPRRAAHGVVERRQALDTVNPDQYRRPLHRRLPLHASSITLRV